MTREIRPTESDVHDALESIINNREDKALNYAVAYAEMGQHMTGYSLKIQCRYILNNIIHWRREGNREVRDVLKRFVR